MPLDGLHEECGVFGIFNSPSASAHTALGLHALQHRGQEAVGIVSQNGGQFHARKAMGLVGDSFSDETVIASLAGRNAIGHVRYSTSGETEVRNIQPLFAEFAFGGVAIAHNGNLTNAYSLRQQLVAEGCIFQSTSDTETIIHLMARAQARHKQDALIAALQQVEGAYSLVVLSEDSLVGVRDPYGVRPLVLGTLEGAYILASETCALDIIGATYVRDIEPGEMVVITDSGLLSLRPFPARPSKLCIFEYVYFARPDSRLDNTGVYAVRRNIGMELAREHPTQADIVVPIPDSGVPAALGYAAASGIPFELGIIRNHYVGRTFIEPTDQIRHLGVRLKHNANPEVLRGKRVILVDDSIVRGTTSTKIVDMVRAAGAREVHMRIASPPTTHSCFYGVDTPSRDKLLAARHSLVEMNRIVGSDSLAFISLDGLYRAVMGDRRNGDTPQYCDACFSGEYPLPLTDKEAEISHKRTLKEK